MSRELLEEQALDLLGENISTLNPHHLELINKSKTGCFGFSYLGFMLYGNGRNPNSFSKTNPCGLIYYDGENIFSLAFFRKELEPEGNYHLHIISPHGVHSIKKAIEISILLKKSITLLAEGSIYLRHLSLEQYDEAIELGAYNIKSAPWHPEAHSEDETYNHRIIDICEILDCLNEIVTVKKLSSGGSRGFRSKTKLAYNRFNNFLCRNNLIFKPESISKCDT